MKQVTVYLLILLTLSACHRAGPGLVAQRYEKATYAPPTENDAEDYVSIETASYPVTAAPPPRQKGLFDLSDRGQEAYITALAGKEKDADGLIARLTTPLESKQPANENKIDKTGLSRKLVFSIKIGEAKRKPANRIERIDLALKLSGTNDIKFLTWDKIVTESQVVDIGKLTFGETTSFSIAPEISLAGDVLGKLGGGGWSHSRTAQEEVTIKDRYVISGTLSDKKAILSVKGVTNVDLSGNLIVDIEFKADSPGELGIITFGDLFDNGEPETDIKKIKIGYKHALYPNLCDAVKGDLEYSFVFREVTEGHETVPEGDDTVVFRRGNGTLRDIAIIKRGEHLFKTWQIMHKDKDLLHILLAGRDVPTLINFQSNDDADTFLKWLRSVRHKDTIPDALLKPFKVGSAKPLLKSDISGLEVRIVKHPHCPDEAGSSKRPDEVAQPN